MKKIRIWLNSFTLMQQFMSIAMLTTAFIMMFFFSFYTTNIDNFVNNQMFAYIHRSQNAFINSRENYQLYEDANVKHIIRSKTSKSYLSDTNGYDNLLDSIDYANVLNNTAIDNTYIDNENNRVILYSYIDLNNEDYTLISILRNEYREDFKNALLNVVINISIVLLFGLFSLFMIWVLSLIHPLNQIRNYINKLKLGEEAELKINRHDEIGEVAEALTSMNDELSKQQRIREEMIQNISHDLKTPIATIKSYSESIKDGIYPYDTLEKSVDVIYEHADRLEKKVFSLVTFNKLGYLSDIVEEGDNLYMPDVIGKAILSCSVLRNDVTIETEIDENVYFHGEEEPWRVVVENLLDNGLRYAKSVVRIKLEENLLEIFNDGELLSKDRISKLFKPYEKGTKGNFGLGLSIVRRVTETYGYNVTGENMDDGVVFRVFRQGKKTKKSNNK